MAANIKEPDKLFLTMNLSNTQKNQIDIKVGKIVAQSLNGQHKVLSYDTESSKRLKSCNQNGMNCVSQTSIVFYDALMANGFEGYMIVKGSGAEIFRDPYGRIKSKLITPELLCRLFDIPINNFSSKIVSDWLKTLQAENLPDKVNILDLFYWEHRMGSWLAGETNACSKGIDFFTPFNNRSLIENLLLLKSSFTTRKWHKLLKKSIRTSNPMLDKIRYNRSRCSLLGLIRNLLIYYFPYLKYKLLYWSENNAE